MTGGRSGRTEVRLKQERRDETPLPSPGDASQLGPGALPMHVRSAGWLWADVLEAQEDGLQRAPLPLPRYPKHP